MPKKTKEADAKKATREVQVAAKGPSAAEVEKALCSELGVGDLARRDVELDPSPVGGAEFFGVLGADALLVAQQQSGCQLGAAARLGIDEPIPPEVAKVILDDTCSGH